MSLRTRNRCIAALALALATSPGSADAEDVLVTPIYAFRHAGAIVAVSNSDDWLGDSDQDQTDQFGPFDFDRALSVTLPQALSQGHAMQSSDISASSIHADATLSTSTRGTSGTAASVIGWNDFQVIFSVDAPGAFTLLGNLEAAGEATCTFRLMRLVTEDIDHFFTVANDSIALSITGTLPTGEYALIAQIEGTTNVDLADDASLEASGRFEFDFAVCAATPIEDRSWGDLKQAFR